MSKPIHIVVPTRERADTLYHCLRTVVAQDSDRIKILVSDNASSAATRDTVMGFNDPRISYVNTGERVSMAHNYEFALSHVHDGWIVMVGDDDGLLPGRLVPMIERLEDSGLQTLSSDTGNYNWPQAAPDSAVRLSIPLDTEVERVDCKQAVQNTFRWRWHKLALPQTYTGGIVDAALYQKLRAIRGSFYQSQIPDVYSGYALAGATKEYLRSAAPFSIAGRSSHSIGTKLFNLEKTAFLDEGLIPLHADFPVPAVGTLSFSFPAIISECYRQSEYIHHNHAGISNQDMLELILAESPFVQEHLLAWGKDFAAAHGLDYDAAVRKSQQPNWARKISLLRWRMGLLWRRARVYRGDPRPTDNIMEAVQTADAILRSPPSRIAETVGTLKRYASSPDKFK